MKRILLLTLMVIATMTAQVRVTPGGSGALQEARHLERLGRNEEAREIYRSILVSNPRHSQAYNSLKNNLIRDNRLEEASLVISSYIAAAPNDLSAQIELGEIYYRLEEKKAALSTWRDLEVRFSNNQSYYRNLINTLARLSLFSEIDSVTVRARKQFNDPSFLAMELANYHFARGSISKAVDEYINHLLVHPKQQKYVTDRILLLSDKPENHSFIESKLQARLLDNDILIRTILAGFYFKIEDFEQSIVQHQQLGLVTQDDLQRWLNLANALLAEEQYAAAIAAFQSILESDLRNRMPSRVMGEALLGIGQAFEKQIVPPAENQSLIGFLPENIIFEDHFFGAPEIDINHLESSYRLYDSILVELPTSAYLARAHHRLGEIKYRITRDFDGALQSYQAALGSRPNKGLMRQLELRIGDVYLAQGKFDHALEHYLRQMQSQFQEGEISPFLIRLIQTNLLSGDVESALTLCETSIQTASPINNYYNDLMEIQDLIITCYQDNDESGQKVFLTYLDAEALIRQNKLVEGLEILLDLNDNGIENRITPLLTLRAALLARTLQNSDLALQLANKLDNTDFADRGLVLRGEIFEYMHQDSHQALGYYHRLLEEYPQSLLLEPVRLHIREINSKLGS